MDCSRSLQGLAAAVACALLTAPAALAEPTSAFASATAKAATAKGEDAPLNLPTAKGGAQQAASNGDGGIVRTIVGLAVVIGVIYGLHWILKTVKANRESRSTGGGLEPISTLQLGPGRSLHLIRAGSEIVLVGTGDHGVTPIRTYGEDEARALGLLDLEQRQDDEDTAHAPKRAPVAALTRVLAARGLVKANAERGNGAGPANSAHGGRAPAAFSAVAVTPADQHQRARSGGRAVAGPPTIGDLVRTLQRWTVRG